MQRGLVLLLFFVSGAAGLVYEVAWARSLGLVFGASHLAVATVLAVYMGGQALGSSLFGGRADKTNRPLFLYGVLEVGVGISALTFLAAMELYPKVYGPLARLGEGSGLYLTCLRTTFAVVAMMVPATLMGGTLPVLTRFVTNRGAGVARQVSFLYALNTFGAVAGTAVGGFVLLKSLGVTVTLLSAAATSTAVGVMAMLAGRRPAAPEPSEPGAGPAIGVSGASSLARRLTLLGIGVSGFCALGYEVLWARMLTLVVGTSVYSFTVMLAAFLAGIGCGSQVFGLVCRGHESAPRRSRAVLVFAASQLAIGVSALAVTVLMRDLPHTAQHLERVLVGLSDTIFGGRLIAAVGVAFAFMFVPAFFMGLAFPAAGAAWSAGTDRPGRTIGRLLTVNTVGAIFGSLVTGFVLIDLLGIERSLHALVLLNLAVGLAVALSTVARRLTLAVPVVTALLLVLRGAYPDWGRVWDQKFFAIYTNSTRTLATPEAVNEALENYDVLYYHEGVNETVSAVRAKGSIQTFIVNGRPEASTDLVDVQLQRTLGHLPMLLHPNPRKAFVLGTGTGMTLGAVSVHPELNGLVLGEIEEGMLGVARTFERWNHRVLDDPKLRIVFNDGRNFLTTTREKFDVITADPIHPWSGGAGYLYTREYFGSVADRLEPGGIACQWLPLYELSVHDVRTVVRTFAASFQHVMVWLTYYDAVLIGSNAPIVIDQDAIARRVAVPAIHDDLVPIHMTSASDFISFFLMGTEGARAFGQGGDLNTDDNLALEFSAPASQGVRGLDGKNLRALAAFRESLLPFLAARPPEVASADRERWSRHLETSAIFDEAHARFLLGVRGPDLDRLLAQVQARDPSYAPLSSLLDAKTFMDRTEPALVEEVRFEVRTPRGAPSTLHLSVVRQFVGRERVLVSFVDNPRHVIYGQRYLDGPYDQLDPAVASFVAQTLGTLRTTARELEARTPQEPPAESQMQELLRREVGRLVQQAPGGGRASPGER